MTTRQLHIFLRESLITKLDLANELWLIACDSSYPGEFKELLWDGCTIKGYSNMSRDELIEEWLTFITDETIQDFIDQFPYINLL